MTDKQETGIGAAIVVIVSFALGTPIVMAARSDGRVDYCYSHATAVAGQSYAVVGHRPWREDAVIGFAPTPEAAAKIIEESPVCKDKRQ
jgi:hypothetical protein